MPSYHARYGPPAWALTRDLIGQELRTLYDLPTELPPHLLAVAHRLGAMETSRPNKDERLRTPLHRLVRKLDALEGEQLLRRCNQRLRDLPKANLGALT